MSKGSGRVYPSDNYTNKGITLREYYAGLALQGLLSNSSIELIVCRTSGKFSRCFSNGTRKNLKNNECNVLCKKRM